MGTDIHALPIGHSQYDLPEDKELYAYARASMGRLDLWRILCKESYEAAQVQLDQMQREKMQLSLPCAEIPAKRLWLRLGEVWFSYLDGIDTAFAWEIIAATTNFCAMVSFVNTCARIESASGHPANIWWFH